MRRAEGEEQSCQPVGYSPYETKANFKFKSIVSRRPQGALQGLLLSDGSLTTEAPAHFMTAMLKTLDQLPGVGTFEGPPLSFPSREVSAREIVRARVAAE